MLGINKRETAILWLAPHAADPQGTGARARVLRLQKSKGQRDKGTKGTKEPKISRNEQMSDALRGPTHEKEN